MPGGQHAATSYEWVNGEEEGGAGWKKLVRDGTGGRVGVEATPHKGGIPTELHPLYVQYAVLGGGA